MMKLGDAVNENPDMLLFDKMDGKYRVDPETFEENLMFGNPEDIIKKLEMYKKSSLDAFINCASMGL